MKILLKINDVIRIYNRKENNWNRKAETKKETKRSNLKSNHIIIVSFFVKPTQWFCAIARFTKFYDYFSAEK